MLFHVYFNLQDVSSTADEISANLKKKEKKCDINKNKFYNKIK